MNNLIKLGVYVAAGVGVYELLRRTGGVEKLGAWLNEQLPQDLKQRAAELGNQARRHGEDLVNQAQDAVQRATRQYNEPMTEEADTQRPGGNGYGNGNRAAPGFTGHGQGVPVTTDDYAGTHVPHKVGRGVIR